MRLCGGSLTTALNRVDFLAGLNGMATWRIGAEESERAVLHEIL